MCVDLTKHLLYIVCYFELSRAYNSGISLNSPNVYPLTVNTSGALVPDLTEWVLNLHILDGIYGTQVKDYPHSPYIIFFITHRSYTIKFDLS